MVAVMHIAPKAVGAWIDSLPAIYTDADGFVWVDQTKIYRSELGEWGQPESFISLV